MHPDSRGHQLAGTVTVACSRAVSLLAGGRSGSIVKRKANLVQSFGLKESATTLLRKQECVQHLHSPGLHWQLQRKIVKIVTKPGLQPWKYLEPQLHDELPQPPPEEALTRTEVKVCILQRPS
ncbi:hypothetical protein BKA62DRAFT_758728 [Auriculariales sp. MPI-PUGE-AT-0066]|nr:hypothetical protein BKA62DRAFT_758728 [Auriculariales sp. MPI-PUGE-AT-0066]